MSRVVYLHVGAPKTGTTYLQDRLALNKASLARHGVHYPLSLHASQFRPALDLLEMPWGGLQEDVDGEWDALAARVRRLDGTVVVSHEILAAAQAGAGRAGDDRARGQRGAPRLLRPRPRPADPRRVAGGRQAPAQASASTRFLRQVQTSERIKPNMLVLAGAEPSRRAEPLEQRAAARARAPGDGAAGGRPARPAVAPLLPGVRHRPRLGAGGERAGERLDRRGRDRSCCAGSTVGSGRPGSPRRSTAG